jgi:hypothetical protein
VSAATRCGEGKVWIWRVRASERVRVGNRVLLSYVSLQGPSKISFYLRLWKLGHCRLVIIYDGIGAVVTHVIYDGCLFSHRICTVFL